MLVKYKIIHHKVIYKFKCYNKLIKLVFKVIKRITITITIILKIKEHNNKCLKKINIITITITINLIK
jgi:hypothetical protein